MLKPRISEMRRVQSGPRVCPKIAPKPKPAPNAVPSIPRGIVPTQAQRDAMKAREYKWCAPCHAFLPYSEFATKELDHGGPCAACVARKNRAVRARADTQREAYASRGAVLSPNELRAAARALSLPDLITQIIEASTLEPEVQKAMLRECRDGRIERHGKAEGLRLWRECPETGLEMLWMAGRRNPKCPSLAASVECEDGPAVGRAIVLEALSQGQVMVVAEIMDAISPQCPGLKRTTLCERLGRMARRGLLDALEKRYMGSAGRPVRAKHYSITPDGLQELAERTQKAATQAK